MMIIYKSRFLTRGEVWFDSEPGDTCSVDWILYNQCSRPVPGTRVNHFYTYAVDLTQSVDELKSRLDKDTVSKIRRGRDRDEITCENCNLRDRKVMERFEQTYNVFAAIKGLEPLERGRMESMAEAGALELRAAKDSQGNILVYHGNFCDNGRVAGLISVSLFRKLADKAARGLIGRANRFLIWTGFLHYKEQGMKWFDFGGWYHGTDPAMLKVNHFKQSFGGQVLREYQCERIVTLKGRVVLFAAGLLKRTRLMRRSRRDPATAPFYAALPA